jgi:hypothetical protein
MHFREGELNNKKELMHMTSRYQPMRNLLVTLQGAGNTVKSSIVKINLILSSKITKVVMESWSRLVTCKKLREYSEHKLSFRTTKQEKSRKSTEN